MTSAGSWRVHGSAEFAHDAVSAWQELADGLVGDFDYSRLIICVGEMPAALDAGDVGLAVFAQASDKDILHALEAGAREVLVLAHSTEAKRAVAHRLAHHLRLAPVMEWSAAGPAGMVGDSPQMKEVYGLISKLAPHTATVLIQGDSGTGKELVAKAIHELSPRAGKSFVAVNCGAIPGPLLESELFGHLKGAFTDANRDKRGLLEEASGGTIFLDEIAELPLDLQSKLLRVLQEGEVRPLGATNTRTVDVRVVAATLKDLEAEVAAGNFREDLFFRLNVLPITLPALKDRTGDIPLLASFLLEQICKKQKAGDKKLSDDALATLKAHSWPGNVRELQNVLERAVVLADGDVIEHISITRRTSALPLAKRIAAFEKNVIAKTLREAGDVKKAAEKLGLEESQLQTKMSEHGL